MALPDLAGPARSATRDRVAGLGQSIAGAVTPTKLASQSFDAVKSQISAEVPELAQFTDGVADFARDFSSNLERELSKNTFATEENTTETVNKLDQIKQDTGKTKNDIDSLLEVIKVVDYKLFEQLNNDQEQLAELRNISGVTEDARNISTEQLALIRKQVDLDKKQEKRDDFGEQVEKSKTTATGSLSNRTTEDAKNNKNNVVLVGFARILGDLARPLGLLAAAAAGGFGLSKLFAQRSEFEKKRLIAEKRKEKREDFLRRQNLRDEKTGRFRKATREDRLEFNERFNKRQDRFKRLGAGAAGAAGLAGSAATIGAVVTLFFGLISGGIRAYLAGEDFKGILQNSLRSMVVAPFQLASDLITGMFGAQRVDMGKVYDALTDGLASAYKFALYDIPNFISSLWDDTKKVYSRTLEKITSLPEKIGSFFTDMSSSVVDTFKVMKSNIINAFKGMANNIIDSIPGARKLVPDSVNTFLTTTETPQLTTRTNNAEQAATMLVGQQQIVEFNRDRDLAALDSAREMQSFINQPVQQNISNQTFFPDTIMTRNPESPVFLRNKVQF